MSKDHREEMKGRLLAQFANKRLLEGLTEALGSMLNDIETAFDDLQEKRWIYSAEGSQLDGAGVIVGQSRIVSKAIPLPFFGFRHQPNARGFKAARFRRNGELHRSSAILSDIDYRKMVMAKVAKNISQGTAEEVISSYAMIFDAKKVILQETDNAKIRIGIGRELTPADIVFADAIKLFVKPGGIGIQARIHFDAGQVFGFRNQGYQGFGAGKFARQF